MSALRDKTVPKTREELIEEYCNKTGEKPSIFKGKNDTWVKSLVKTEGIAFNKRVYFSLDRTFKVEIQQDGKITSTFTVVGDTVEKAIRAKSGYSVKLNKVERKEDADMIVTLIDSELGINKTTKRVNYYEIVATYIYQGRRYTEVDWETGTKKVRPTIRRA